MTTCQRSGLESSYTEQKAAQSRRRTVGSNPTRGSYAAPRNEHTRTIGTTPLESCQPRTAAPAVAEAAVAHGYSRAAFYLVAAAFDQSGMAGLIDERRGRRGPVKLRPEIVEFIRAEAGSGAQIAEQVAEQFGVRLHRRTIERVRGR